ncbi:MAG: guanylate kinase [Tissierellia bacterium]|jgi:guanylate kinase|nr:guanylate kinase [Tissierellia bacterium]
MFKRRGRVFVISGPSGVGKGTLVRDVLKQRSLHLSISYTSREPRFNEEEAKSYHFISKDNFKKMIDEGAFAEWAEVYGNYYGTPQRELEKHLARGEDVILEIEMLGAGQIRKMGEDAVLIFVLPPNLNMLEERLSSRGTESEEAIAQRLSCAMDELKYLKDYDYYLVNNDIENTTRQLLAIMEAESHSVSDAFLTYLDKAGRGFSL